MNTTESLGYLKGLLDGLDLDKDKKETKLFKAIIDVVENLSKDIDDVYEEIDGAYEIIDAIDSDLSDVEDVVFDDEDDCCDCDCCDDCDGYELQCPICGSPVYIDEDSDFENGVECPACGEILQIEPADEDEDETSNDKN
ncbi:MAG: hypothetical protein LUH82_04245 [Clostridiales bacterium]|nr:hypothetical protein [Clostridiales bacterium]